MMRPQIESLILVSQFQFLKAREQAKLLRNFPDHTDILGLTQTDLEQIIGRPLCRARWLPLSSMISVERGMAWVEHKENQVLWLLDSAYPSLLKEIFDPPAVLFVRGTLDIPWDRCVAIVGTRSPDETALGSAFDLGHQAAMADVPVVSGLALGIDGASHRGVVHGDGAAVAVMGSGIDTVYPRRHRELAADILDSGGVLLSEYPPGVPVQRHQFPARNRIITGSATALCVVQAPARSGALISVDYALDQGRDVWVHAVGTGEGEENAGTRSLIEQGAPVLNELSDLLPGTDTVTLLDQGIHGDLKDPRLALFGPITPGDGDPRETMVAHLRSRLQTVENAR